MKFKNYLYPLTCLVMIVGALNRFDSNTAEFIVVSIIGFVVGAITQASESNG